MSHSDQEEIEIEIETWKSIPGYPLYEVSDWGRVRLAQGTSRNPAGYILSTSSDGKVLRVNLNTPAPKYQVSKGVHQLVMLAFKGPTPKGLEICHIDGNHKHCHISNLVFDTHERNMADMIRHGTSTRKAHTVR